MSSLITRQLNTSVPPASTVRAGDGENDPRRWLMLSVLLLGQFMALVDMLIVNVAMPAIGADLRTSGATLQLVVAGYTITYAMLLITGARLGAVLGRKTMYLTGTAVFTLASLGCGLAPNGTLLVAFRCVQGAGAALMVPQIMSVIQLRFAGAARAKALSTFGAVLASGSVVGLVFGGLIVSADLFGLSWRPAFLVNVPFGLLLVLAAPRVLPADPPRTRPRIDLAGLTTATSAVLLIVFPLTLGHQFGWPAWTFAAMGAGLVLAVAFVAVEHQVAARGGIPLLDLAVLRAPGLGTGLITLALMQVACGGLLFSFTLHLEAGLGDSALRAGLTYVPMASAFGLVGYYWRRLPERLHPYVAQAGLACCAIGYATLAHATPLSGHGEPLAAVSLIIAGLGMGLSASPLLTQSLQWVPRAQAADASGLLTTTVQLSQVIGVAAFGTLFLQLRDTLPHVTASSQAMSTTCIWLAVVAALGALAGTPLTRSLLAAAHGK